MNHQHKTKAILTREHNMAFILGIIRTTDRQWTSEEIATKTQLTPKAVTLILYDLERERLVTRHGMSRVIGVRWSQYEEPQMRVFEFKPLKPLKSTVIPVRGNGRLAPDIYRDVVFVGVSR